MPDLKRGVRWSWIFLLLPSLAGAWGRQGHQTIALVAEGLLTPAAKQWVDGLRLAPGWQDLEPGDSRYFRSADEELIRFCQGPSGDLSLVAEWADAWREYHPQTGALHFVNIPLSSDGSLGALDAACGGNCILTQLDRSLAVLRDPSGDPHARLEALLWVVHLVGDIHQPLHCADNHDRGGNTVEISLLGRRENLHAAWDTGFFYVERTRPEDLAADLLANECTSVAKGPADPAAFRAWARQSFSVAKGFVYPQERLTRGRFKRSDVDAAWPVLRLQLARAGVRLAALLNGAAATR